MTIQSLGMRPIGLTIVCLYLAGSSALVLYLSWTMWQAGTIYLGLGQLLVPLVRSESYIILKLLSDLNSFYSFVIQGVLLAVLACALWARLRWTLWATIAFQLFVLMVHVFTFALILRHIGLEGANPAPLKLIAAVAILAYLLRPKTRHLFLRS